MGRDKKKKKKKKMAPRAERADRHALYQLSVQEPSFEIGVATHYFEERVGRSPLSLREDFCGTALLCSAWVSGDPKRTALGVDIDASVLAWGRDHVLADLDESQRARVTIVEGDVRDLHPGRHDVVMALNYSYFCFKSRDALRGYFSTVKEHLRPDGLFFIDLFGGWEARQLVTEKRKVENFKYVWEQAAYDPISGDFLAHIHFHFRDGSKMKEAFTYDWRLWTIPELRELLAEAGFAHVECLWEDEDEHGRGTGGYSPQERASNDPAWNAYLMASVEVPPVVASAGAPQAPTG